MADAQNVEYIQLATAERNIAYHSESPFDAVVLRSKNLAYKGIVIETADGTFQVSTDEHFHCEQGYSHSNPIIFETPVIGFEISGLSPGLKLTLALMRIPDPASKPSAVHPRNGCDKPAMVLQEEWRQGLPSPDYERVFNEVRNIILHHSATSNSITDHTALVRSIYTYHTQINGWSDMGYNYLIAPDGSIYAGRDPGNLVHEDEVLGAHFCASNTGTMGICLLGTFTEAEPTAEAMRSLDLLLSWKMAKDSLYPLGTNAHPLNPQLGIIAGHRHGCATLCPGDAFLELFPHIKENSNASLHNCGVFLNVFDHQTYSRPIVVTPNPIVNGRAFIELKGETAISVALIRADGIRFPVNFNQEGIKLYLQTDVPQGIYVLVVSTKSNTYSTKLIKLNK